MARQENQALTLVADTNVVAAAILRSGATRNILFNSNLKVYSPEGMKEELWKHKAEFAAKMNVNENGFEQAAQALFTAITTIDAAQYAECEEEAKRISPDPDDWPFFALALHLKCALWSNDKQLKAQDRVAVRSTEELLRELMAELKE